MATLASRCLDVAAHLLRPWIAEPGEEIGAQGQTRLCPVTEMLQQTRAAAKTTTSLGGVEEWAGSLGGG